MNPFKRLWELIKLEKQEVWSIYYYSVLSGLLQLTVPVGIQAIIGFVMGATMVTSIYVLSLLVVLGVLLVGILQINQMKIIEKIQQNIFVRYAFDFAEKIPRFDLIKLDSYYLPEKVNRIFEAINVQKGISKLLLDIPTASIQIIFSLILLSLYHSIFILFGFLLLAVLYLMVRLTAKKGIRTSLQESGYKYEVVAWLQEMGRVIKSFKFSQGSQMNLKKTDENVHEYVLSRTAHFKVLLLQYRALVFFKVMITASMLIVGTNLLINQQINIGEFIAAEIVILTIINAVEKLIGSLDSIYDVITGLEKLASVTESVLEKEGSTILGRQENGLRVELINFSFEYPKQKLIFRDFSILVPEGSTVCISGAEGAGKTTFLKILSGNYSNFSGALLIDNKPIHQYKLESLRKQLGVYLLQEDIFKGTLFENISMGRASVTDMSIMQVANNLGIDFFKQLFQIGFDCAIDNAGKRPSSSMIKKILLLRALVDKPPLLLLEEPWLGLEIGMKDRITNYILHHTKNATVFITSNDESFAKKCDYKMLIDNREVTLLRNI
ncbi:MAG: ABC transporter ATP-binding protein [Bacteroidota bacterium]|nr:ABC transporter ATP-binding protein [Bacteroidota bacterium]